MLDGKDDRDAVRDVEIVVVEENDVEKRPAILEGPSARIGAASTNHLGGLRSISS
jgi:hypothetical protein